jgi:hypothetical protein
LPNDYAEYNRHFYRNNIAIFDCIQYSNYRDFNRIVYILNHCHINSKFDCIKHWRIIRYLDRHDFCEFKCYIIAVYDRIIVCYNYRVINTDYSCVGGIEL